MLIPALSAWWQWECEEVILFLETGAMRKEEEEENLIDPSVGRETDTASCSAVSNPPESHLALFLLATPPSHPLMLPQLSPPTLTDWRKWTSANWPQWRGKGDSETTSALLSNHLTCGLSPSSSVSVPCIKLASESSLFGSIVDYGLWALCLYWTM